MNRLDDDQIQTTEQSLEARSRALYDEERVIALQTLLIHAIKGIAMYMNRARQLAVADRLIDRFTTNALYVAMSKTTAVTDDQLATMIFEAAHMRDRAQKLYEWVCGPHVKIPEQLWGPALWQPGPNLDCLISQGRGICTQRMMHPNGFAAAQLEHLCLHELKHSASHLSTLRAAKEDVDEVLDFFYSALNLLACSTDLVILSKLARQVEEMSFTTTNQLPASLQNDGAAARMVSGSDINNRV